MPKIKTDIVYEIGDDILVKDLLGMINTRQVTLDTENATTFTVGDGGDYTTLQEALVDASKVTITTDTLSGTGTDINIEILANYAMAEQVIVNSDLSNVLITGEPIIIDMDVMDQVFNFPVSNNSYTPAIYIMNGVSPIFDVDIVCNIGSRNIYILTDLPS